uniref:Uncharacterized protein n=1 Tax=Solanum lycopersicum TaxID=4081 RepID=A0A3Q7ENF5_SOLLC
MAYPWQLMEETTLSYDRTLLIHDQKTTLDKISRGEFSGKLQLKGYSDFLLHKTPDLANDPEERAKLRHKPLQD